MKMRSLGLLLLVLSLLTTAAVGEAASSRLEGGDAPTEAPNPIAAMDAREEKDIYALLMGLFASHLSAHEEVVTSPLLRATGGEFMRGKYVLPPQDTALGCIDIAYSVPYGVPANESALRNLLTSIIEDAYLIQQADAAARFVQDGNLSFSFPSAGVWWYGPFSGGKAVLAPLMLSVEAGEPSMFFIATLSDTSSTQIWLCADRVAVYDCYAAMDWAKDETGFAEAAQAWMADFDEVHATPAPTDTPIATPPPATPTPAPTPRPEGIIGEVTVGENRVNIRDIPSTLGAIIGRGAPGAVLGCFGEIGGDDNSRWYDVLLDDGARGYMPAAGGTLVAQDAEGGA